MKRKISILIMLLIFSGTLFFQSCDEEPVPFKEYGAFTIPELVAPANGAFLTPSGTKVDLKWSSTDAEGDPQKWDVYFGPSEEPARVATGHSSQTYSATVDIGTKYFWRVVGYDANGIPTRSDTWSFEIVDPDAPLKMKMVWSTNILDKIGLDVDPEVAADLRLTILDEEFEPVEVVNTSAFEEYEFTSDLPDGKYYIVTDLASTVNAGDFNSSLDVSINLSFNQRGILSQSLPFPNVMTTDFTCDSYVTYLAEVVKEGATYTLTSNPSAKWSAEVSDLVGNWTGTDNWAYPNEVETTVSGENLMIYGMGFEWMVDWWGETVVRGNPVPVVFDWTTLGGVEIEDQYYITTNYKGVEYPYNIVGSGRLNLCGSTPVLTLEYDLIQDGFSIGDYYGELFKVVLTLAPAGKGYQVVSTETKFPKKMRLPKPVR
ncbi:MAG TPA: hypothetical protein PK521_15075 [Bacteroidales bacterium]|nr:hypothetical protein [Bacteroidales bacterium]